MFGQFVERPVRVVTATAVTLIAMLALLGFASTADARRPHRSCKNLSGLKVQRTKSVLIVKQSRDAGRAYVACWRATGKRRVFVRIPWSEPDGGLSLLVRGRWLLWERHEGGTGDILRDTGSMGSLDVKHGRAGPTVTTRSDLAGPTNGPVAMTVGDSDDLDAVLTTNGWFAWIVACCPETRGGERVEALYVPDGNGGARRLDVARGSASITYLRASGQVIRWRNGGQARQARLG